MSQTFINNFGAELVRTHLQDIPRPDRHAAQAIRGWAKSQGSDLDPEQTDVVTLHYRGNQAIVVQRQSLTEAVLSNWQGETDKNLVGQLFPGHWSGTLPPGPIQIVDRLPTRGPLENGADYSVFNGLFRRTDNGQYDSTTHLSVDVEAMQRFIWDLDFHTRFTAMLDNYWQRALHGHQLSMRISFVAACNRQVSEGSLSDSARQLAWQAAGLMPRAKGLRISPLNIYGYAATDLLCITDNARPQVLLYLPGNASPLHEFTDMAALQDWLAEQCQAPEKRQQLRQHFNLADTPDGLDFSGLDTALEGLGAYPGIHHRSPNRPGFTTDGRWSPRDYVNYRPNKYSPVLEGDLFAALSLRQRKRSYADADFIITSDHEVTKARWRGYLVSTINLLAPLAVVLPELAPLLAMGGVAQFAAGIDQAINGKTLDDKAEGVTNIEFGLMNAAPLVLRPLAEPRVRFPVKSRRFVFPRRVNDQLGYPLSPITPSAVPEHQLVGLFGSTVPPLPGGDTDIAQWLVRVPASEDSEGQLQSVLSGYNTLVLYDSEHDAFILESEANEVSPAYYQVSAESRGLVGVEPSTRAVTDSIRTSSLRAMGVEVQLPLEIPPFEAQLRAPIARKISSIWIGDKVIAPKLLTIIARNSQRVTTSQYAYRLFLSNANAQAFSENLRLLAAQAPNLDVLPLEEQPFFARFRDSKYFEQYRDAVGGAGANFSSASDILRYPLLAEEGGLYLDVDDALVADPAHPENPSRAAIDSVTLATTPDGLVLGAPMNNDSLGMYCQYNTNMIGSHAGNPTLQAISDAMHERYLANRDFYDHRPVVDSPEFDAYALRLSHMTGPALLNDVIDQRLPRLRALRQIINLHALPQHNAMYLVSPVEPALREAATGDIPLNQVAEVGNFHSWARP
ncbi:dermonecrotic toxin domain-containing protein [Pseudomonas entomophila]|uniref:Dermonecrotic toxin N-terminal domain-containing protein n=2 Tax=Pseudomonas entomophila TaxID=312306 RepID=Q1I781_PSEE4|nr:DUF6543 domain-containing protein [Pseudomonas entomophila]WMW07749.1 glycosyltransferase [Pseudomonas entomophila]CAK16501.1 conserved hypothetical protein [Pseudomonas entomophila L48]